MKKLLSIMTITLFTVIVTANTYAAPFLTYTPTSAAATIEAGASQVLPISVTLNAPISGTYYLWFVDSVTGTLPKAWITPAKSMTFISKWAPTASTTFTVNVPASAAPGVYSGTLLSKAMAAHGYADAGSGMAVEITVPSHCTLPPSFTNLVVNPVVLWPPDKTLHPVTVTGTVVLPPDCTLIDAGYVVDDEYGLLSSAGPLVVDPVTLNFTLNLSLEAWPNKKTDPDDVRTYAITLFAEDEAGVGASPVLYVYSPKSRSWSPPAAATLSLPADEVLNPAGVALPTPAAEHAPFK